MNLAKSQCTQYVPAPSSKQLPPTTSNRKNQLLLYVTIQLISQLIKTYLLHKSRTRESRAKYTRISSCRQRSPLNKTCIQKFFPLKSINDFWFKVEMKTNTGIQHITSSIRTWLTCSENASKIFQSQFPFLFS